jgi:hypothetical protein
MMHQDDRRDLRPLLPLVSQASSVSPLLFFRLSLPSMGFDLPPSHASPQTGAPVMLTAERLRELLDYNPATGRFTWRVYRGGSSPRKGAVAGFDSGGYIRIKINGNTYAASRLAWLYTYGVWPSEELDHINLRKWDNRLANLREATRAENCRNGPTRINSTSGHKGVHWNKKLQKYSAYITYNRVRIYLGLFNEVENAVVAQEAAALKYHGDFANTTL